MGGSTLFAYIGMFQAIDDAAAGSCALARRDLGGS